MQPEADFLHPKLCNAKYSSLHVAIIMDGNGRWAERRGQPRTNGHRVGADRVRDTVEAAARLNLGALTLFAFSADNWKRPVDEVRRLMVLLQQYLANEVHRCRQNDIRVSVIGRRDRLSPVLRRTITRIETLTATCRGLHLRLAVDYSSRTEIESALTSGQRRMIPPVDLLIRTGGERRLSDFLLWECAYAELMFLETPWPEFSATLFHRTLRDFGARERRFGALPVKTPATPAATESV